MLFIKIQMKYTYVFLSADKIDLFSDGYVKENSRRFLFVICFLDATHKFDDPVREIKRDITNLFLILQNKTNYYQSIL